MSKKILVIGMLDSVHLARWINQFVDTDFEIRIFPASHFRKPHKKLHELNSKNIKVLGLNFFKFKLGYVDSIITLRFMSNGVGIFLRRLYLKLYLMTYKPEIIHAIEIQHAGYLVSRCQNDSSRRILTNWGSDIYYFHHFPVHRKLIIESLSWATHYSAECKRDYQFARDLGFSGIELQQIPNAGGFKISDAPIESRVLGNQLIVKCYGGIFGLGSLAIRICHEFLRNNSSANVFMYSVTEDLLQEVEKLELCFKGRVRFSTIRKPLSHEAILAEFENSRVYLGLSKSDGLSTSFLESLVSGVYPIQTNTSCAGEIISLGAEGKIVEPDYDLVLSALNSIYWNEKYLLKARVRNIEIAKKYLDFDQVRQVAITYYN